MSTNQIISLFSKNTAKHGTPSTEVISEIMRYSSLTYTIDENCEDYVTRVSILDISKTDFPKETIDLMLNEGWTVSKDRKYLQIFS
jgi:hypothetical protein